MTYSIYHNPLLIYSYISDNTSLNSKYLSLGIHLSMQICKSSFDYAYRNCKFQQRSTYILNILLFVVCLNTDLLSELQCGQHPYLK